MKMLLPENNHGHTIACNKICTCKFAIEDCSGFSELIRLCENHLDASPEISDLIFPLFFSNSLLLYDSCLLYNALLIVLGKKTFKKVNRHRRGMQTSIACNTKGETNKKLHVTSLAVRKICLLAT
jgi:hypothetical protein